MRKHLLKWLAALTAVALLAGTLAGCAGKQTDLTNIVTQENLVTAAAVSCNAVKDAPFQGGADTAYQIDFAQPTQVNTVILREKTKKAGKNQVGNVLRFRIEAYQNGAFETIYEQDKIDTYRYCAFPALETTALRVVVSEVREGATFEITSVEAYNVEQDTDDFRVTAYIVADRIYDKKNIDPSHFDVITDVILFGLTSFDKDGNLLFNDVEIDGQQVDGKKAFEQALTNVREISEKHDTPLRIYCNFLGPNPEESIDDWNKSMDAKGDIHMLAMKNNQEKLITGITAFLDQYDLGGVFFDYEYPLKQKHWTMYSEFLVALDARLDGKTLGIALADWGIHLSKDAIEAVDMVEVMSYDLFDYDGDHSPFYNCTAKSLAAFEKAGFDRSKLDLGIPFYARPADGGSFWYDYASEAEKLGKFGNKATGTASDPGDPCDIRWYNGYQMVYDKTAYAAQAKAGGMMVWHYACDLPYNNPLSLFRAMGDALGQRD